MTFLDGVKKAGQLGYQALQEKQERIERYKAQYDRLDDKTLYKRWKSSTGDAKLACLFLLQERGCLNQSNDSY